MDIKVDKEKASNETVNIEAVENTPFAVVEIEKKWRIAYRNSIISREEFMSSKDAKRYVKRMNSIDVINAVLLIIESK